MGTVLHVRPSESADGAWAGGRVRVRTATTVAAAVAALEDDSGSVDCVVVERRLGEETALAVVEAVRERRPDLPVVCCSGAPDGEFAAAATRRGASEYFHRETGDASLADRVRTYLPDAAEAGEGGITEDGAVDADAALAEADGGLSVAVGAGTDGAASSDDGARMAALLDAVEDGLYVLDAEGRFEAVNEAMAALTGYSVERLVGSHVSLIVDEATAERAVAEIERLHESDVTATTFETTIDPADGDPFAAEDHLTLLTDDRGEITGLAGVVRDVSDRREREAELERYASIIEAVDDAVYALDDQGRFEVINDALTDLTGYDREELLGEHTAVIKDDATVAKAEDKLRELLRGRDVETTFELQLQRESGSPVTCEDHMTMLTDDGDFDGTAGVIRDITDRKERERQLRRARERLADLLDSSEALLDAHSREAVAEVVTNAAADALGFDHTLVRLYDPDGDRLTAVSGSGNGGDETDRPTYAADEGGPGAAFAAGEIRHYPADFEADGADADVDLPPEIVEALYVPLGDRGVLSIGATERGAFDERDRSMVEILASNAAVALERVSYESELVQYRTVLENVQDMVYVVDEDERFSLVTDPLAAWLGYDSEELVGAHPSEVLDETETEAFEQLLDHLSAELDFESSYYNESYLDRRISARMRRRDVEGYDEYLDLVRSDPEEPTALLDSLSINVTSFYRNPEAWEPIREALREVTAGHGRTRVWSAPCSDGREPYSLAMLALDDDDIRTRRLEIIGTDINADVLDRAREGVYQTTKTRDVASELEPLDDAEQYVDRDGDTFVVRPAVKELVSFEQHDLIADAPKRNVDLVLCRNLLIYINTESKRAVVDTVLSSLRDGGYLVIGMTETLPQESREAVETVDKRRRVYRRT